MPRSIPCPSGLPCVGCPGPINTSSVCTVDTFYLLACICRGLMSWGEKHGQEGCDEGVTFTWQTTLGIRPLCRASASREE